MRNISIEQFYKKIRKKVALIGKYLERDVISNIIISCRLKPINYFTSGFKQQLVLERVWLDEFNNVLELKNKKFKIHWNMGRNLQKTTTDIYRNESFKFLWERSKNALIGIESQRIIVLLKGTDDYLRAFNIVDEQFNICSPLIVGMKVLEYYFIAKPRKFFQKLKIKSELKELQNMEWVIISFPISEDQKNKLTNFQELRGILIR